MQLKGQVVKGASLGRKLGYPTANLDRRDYARRKLRIRLGIYAGYADIGKGYGAAIIIGPIDKAGLPKIEAHLLGFKGNLYGKPLTITLKQYIRPFRKFKGEEELKKQINRDIRKIKKLT